MSIEFDLFVAFWRTVDENGSIMWRILNKKISILYYFNDENVNLENMLTLLNSFAREYKIKTNSYRIETNGWKLPFEMQKSDSKS